MHTYSQLLTQLCTGAALAGLMLTSCAQPPTPEELGTTDQAIRNGTREPQVIPLQEGEKLAIGWLHQAGFPAGNFCTGTLIAPRVVATASHCTDSTSASRIGFGVGLQPQQPRATFGVAQLHNHPFRDAAILILDQDATVQVPELKIIPFNRAALDNSYAGRRVEAGGYGETYDSSRDGRWFANLLLERITDEFVIVNGEGRQGICFGDSGGPVMTTDAQNRPIVLGVESYGDQNCLGRDHLTRLDAIADWIDQVAGDYLSPDTRPPQEDPPDNQGNNNGPDTPPGNICDTLTEIGQCEGDLLSLCYQGQYYERDCTTLGSECIYVDGRFGHRCSCGDTDYLGRCNGNVAEYCENGHLVRVDCGSSNLSCGYIDGQTGYYCTRSPDCGDVTAQGYCAGQFAVTCQNGNFTNQDCAAQDLVCARDAQGTASCQGVSMPDPDPEPQPQPDPEPEPQPAPDPGTDPGINPDQGNGGGGAFVDDPPNQGEFFVDDGFQQQKRQNSGCQSIPTQQAPVSGSLALLLLGMVMSWKRKK